MAVNKVNFGGNTLIDLTGDTLESAEQLLKGIIAHARDGSVITGLMEAGGGSGGSASVSIEQVYTWTADGTVMSNLDVLAIEPGKLYFAELLVPTNRDLSANASVPAVFVRIGTRGAVNYEGSVVGTIDGQKKNRDSLSKYTFFVRDGKTHIISDRTDKSQTVPSTLAYKGDNVYIYSMTKDNPILDGTTLKIYKLG